MIPNLYNNVDVFTINYLATIQCIDTNSSATIQTTIPRHHTIYREVHGYQICCLGNWFEHGYHTCCNGIRSRVHTVYMDNPVQTVHHL